MRAITVHQPWSWAIAHAGKDVENRLRTFAYRGPLAIHAGRAWEPSGGRSPALREAYFAAAGRWVRDIDPADERFTTGAVVAVTQLLDVHRGTGCCKPWGHVLPLGAAPGAPPRPVYHLVLANTRALEEPVPCAGMRGLWTLPGPVAAAVEAQLQATPSASGPSPSVGSGDGV